MNPVLRMWVVYDHPTDMPDHYVARLFEVSSKGVIPTESVVVSTDLGRVRMTMLEMHLTCVLRQDGDERHIVETWL
jgi:hypothetical protein